MAPTISKPQTRRSICRICKNTDYKGVIGETRFDSKGDLQNATLTLYTIANGKRESLGVQH